MKYILPLVFLSLTIRAQGVSAPWDISQTTSALSAQAERLKPVLGGR